MKKRLAIIVACAILFTSLICVSTSGHDCENHSGFSIDFNGTPTGYETIIYGEKHFVPLRPVFESMGAEIFYRSRDRQVMALSRDGDVITHVIGDNKITVNGEEKTFDNPSFLANNTTYISVDMVSAALRPDNVAYGDKHINIQKYVVTNHYHGIIKDVLSARTDIGFHPERFQRYINFHSKNPQYGMQDVISRVNMGLDYPFYENITVIDKPHEISVLVNKYNQLPSNLKQDYLVNMKKEHTVNDGKVYLLSKVAYEKYIQMYDAARKEGLSLKVLSAHRTESYQRGLYNNKVATSGKVYADNYSARAGHSEHQTGLAVDITTTLTTFEYTQEFKWLQAHAHEYGYIMRYPRGKEWITGYSYEPWHYRYVGVDAATKIYQEGITYEEYYAKYIDVSEYR